MSPDAGMCAEKQRLIYELLSAHRDLIAIGDQEVASVIAGDLDGVRAIGGRLRGARQRRDGAMAALREHIEQHGC